MGQIGEGAKRAGLGPRVSRRTTASRKVARWAPAHAPVDPCDRPHGGKDPSKRCREAVWLAVAIS